MDNQGRIKRSAALQQIFTVRARNLTKSSNQHTVDQIILEQLEQNGGNDSSKENSAKERDPYLSLG